MSLWGEYVAERLNWSVIEDDDSFIAYSLAPPFIRIEDVYVKPEKRRGKKAWILVDKVVAEGRKNPDIKEIWAQVWPGEANDMSLKACLAYGFRVLDAQAGRIMLTKEIGG